MKFSELPLIHGRYRAGSSIMLTVELPALPATLTVDGEEFPLKAEFHMTLIGVRPVRELAAARGISQEEAVRKMTAALTEFTRTHEIKLARFLDDFRVVTAGDRKTVVVRCEATNLEELFAHLRRALGDDTIPTQAAHVTLYERPGEGIRGIGINSMGEFNSYPLLDDATAQPLRRALGLT